MRQLSSIMFPFKHKNASLLNISSELFLLETRSPKWIDFPHWRFPVLWTFPCVHIFHFQRTDAKNKCLVPCLVWRLNCRGGFRMNQGSVSNTAFYCSRINSPPEVSRPFTLSESKRRNEICPSLSLFGQTLYGKSGVWTGISCLATKC